jgi:hypothetical protein
MTVTPPDPPVIPTESILQTTKTQLGLTADYTPFDAELIIFINSVLATLNELGVGPGGGMSIAGYDETWDDFLTGVGETTATPLLNSVKTYTYLRVRMLFDPPSVGYLVTAYEKMIDEQTWRIMVVKDNIDHPLPPPPLTQPSDIYDVLEEMILDGGTP